MEALEEFVRISLQGRSELPSALNEIQEITHRAMEGEISFRKSLEERVNLLKGHRDHLEPLIELLKTKVSKSIRRNKEFFEQHSERIFIISNGFKEFIVPIVTQFGVKEENVYANTFQFDSAGNIVGFDNDNALSKNNGKALKLTELGLTGEVHVIGDGHTDYEIKEAGLAHKFYAFTENVKRENLLEKADAEAPNLDEYLYTQKLNTVFSYPKNRIRVLLLENVHPDAINILKEEGYNVEVHPKELKEEELIERIKKVSILGIRSKTQLTKRVLESAERLLAVGVLG